MVFFPWKSLMSVTAGFALRNRTSLSSYSWSNSAGDKWHLSKLNLKSDSKELGLLWTEWQLADGSQRLLGYNQDEVSDLAQSYAGRKYYHCRIGLPWFISFRKKICNYYLGTGAGQPSASPQCIQPRSQAGRNQWSSGAWLCEANYDQIWDIWQTSQN